MRLSRKGLENIRRGLRRSWADGSHRQRQEQREADPDTLRKRALFDRKGSLFARVTLSESSGQTATYELRWSVIGRTDQLDAFDAVGHKVATCRMSLMLQKLSQLS